MRLWPSVDRFQVWEHLPSFFHSRPGFFRILLGSVRVVRLVLSLQEINVKPRRQEQGNIQLLVRDAKRSHCWVIDRLWQWYTHCGHVTRMWVILVTHLLNRHPFYQTNWLGVSTAWEHWGLEDSSTHDWKSMSVYVLGRSGYLLSLPPFKKSHLEVSKRFTLCYVKGMTNCLWSPCFILVY